MASNVASDVQTLATSYRFGTGDPQAWIEHPCPWCGAPTLLVVAIAETTRWMRCPGCRRGSLAYATRVYPGSTPLSTPRSVPEPDLSVWEEVRACLSVNAHTAAVMLCRKLLFHMAVFKGLPEANAKGRAPGFAEAVEHLEREGVISAQMRRWVDQVKDIGNEANHTIAPITEAQAMKMARFTHQLLVLAYQFPAELEAAAAEES